MTNDLEVKMVLRTGEENKKTPDSMHFEDGIGYSIYASKEFFGDTLAKLNLGRNMMNVFNNCKEAGYEIHEITIKYKSKK